MCLWLYWTIFLGLCSLFQSWENFCLCINCQRLWYYYVMMLSLVYVMMPSSFVCSFNSFHFLWNFLPPWFRLCPSQFFFPSPFIRFCFLLIFSIKIDCASFGLCLFFPFFAYWIGCATPLAWIYISVCFLFLQDLPNFNDNNRLPWFVFWFSFMLSRLLSSLCFRFQFVLVLCIFYSYL